MKVASHKIIFILFLVSVLGCTSSMSTTPTPVTITDRIIIEEPGEQGNRRTNNFRNTVITQASDLTELRLNGQAVFSTPFNVYDGLGDGPSNSSNLKEPGGRLTLPAFPSYGNNPGEGNRFFLRVNGLDSQSCLECHSIVDNSKVPAVFGVGGVGGASAAAFPMASILETTKPNPANSDAATYDGRVINPPFVFGSGGVELLAKEMTASLQKQLAQAPMMPYKPINLKTHTVDFGSVFWKPVEGGLKEPELIATKTNCDRMSAEAEAEPETTDKKTRLGKLIKRKLAKLRHFIAITKAAHIYSDGKHFGEYAEMKERQPTLVLDTSNLKGIDGDLVIKPFGRKGNNITTRDFDCGAIRFHMGMEPVEIVGKGVDHDGDGVKDEVTISEMSALAIYNTTTHRPRQAVYNGSGAQVFAQIGCDSCHIPVMRTNKHHLPYQQPEQPKAPFSTQNQYYQVDLINSSANFEADPVNNGGMLVKLFSDLKRHDMGPRLQESLAGADDSANRAFITARLWGLADTAPYLHDGRATTITEAIKWHGGEAEEAKQKFVLLPPADKEALLNYLRTLHAPTPEHLIIR